MYTLYGLKKGAQFLLGIASSRIYFFIYIKIIFIQEWLNVKHKYQKKKKTTHKHKTKVPSFESRMTKTIFVPTNYF